MKKKVLLSCSCFCFCFPVSVFLFLFSCFCFSVSAFFSLSFCFCCVFCFHRVSFVGCSYFPPSSHPISPASRSSKSVSFLSWQCLSHNLLVASAPSTLSIHSLLLQAHHHSFYHISYLFSILITCFCCPIACPLVLVFLQS